MLTARPFAALRRRVQRVRAAGDTGISLMELIMAIVLSVVLGAITSVLFVAVDKSTAASTDRAIDSGKARNVLQSWTSYLQVADGPTAGSAVNRFEWFSPSSIMFYAGLFNRSQGSLTTTSAPTLIWLRLSSAGQLVEEQFTPIPASFPASPTTCRILSSGVSGTKVFTPFNHAGNDISAVNLGTSQSVGAGCVSIPSSLPSRAQHPDQTAAGNLQSIYTVGINFTITDSRGKHPIQFSAVAALPVLAGSS
jgi:hypothetical protein